MADITTALAQALAPNPAVSTRGYVTALGGPRKGIRTLALLKTGQPASAALPPAGSAERRAYLAARRDIERWLKYEEGGAGQRRKPNARWLGEQRSRVRAAAARGLIAGLRRRGARTRVIALVRVSRDERTRELPAGGPGLSLDRDGTRLFTGLFLAGKLEEAGAAFERLFFLRYGQGEELGFELVDVERVKLWPDGEVEPR